MKQSYATWRANKSVHKWVMVKKSYFMPENRKIPSYFQTFHPHHIFFFLSKTINAVYLTVGKKVMQFWSLKEFLHKWGMVKKSNFLPENQKIHHTFQNYHFNNNPVYSTVILCWRTKSEPYKKKLCTNGLWSKIAILCRKTKSKPHKKKLCKNG